MFKLFGTLLLIPVIIIVVLISVVVFIIKFFSKGSQSRKFRQENNNPNTAYSQQKEFRKNEGEYVDYEEINENEDKN